MKIMYCPQCGGKVRSESIGWTCESCQGFIDMQGGFHPHKEESFVPPMTYECHEFEECEYNGQPECRLPDGMDCPHGVKGHKPTNADRIRAMDDGSLLDFFVESSGDLGCPPNKMAICDEFDKYGRDACRKCWDNYLTSPVEEDTDEH